MSLMRGENEEGAAQAILWFIYTTRRREGDSNFFPGNKFDRIQGASALWPAVVSRGERGEGSVFSQEFGCRSA
jgi:hypothetical protein